MKAKCSVTFEFEMRAPQTWTGELEATTAGPILNRAVRAAMRELRPRNWSSLVAVITERSGVVKERPDDGQTDAVETDA